VTRHRYYCRTSEDYRSFHAPALLTLLGEIRKEICRQRAPLNSPDKEALTKIKEAIDDFAGLVTGDRELFWDKAPRVIAGPPDRA
jgi:hypothetical protein